jgi:hypothetical protein
MEKLSICLLFLLVQVISAALAGNMNAKIQYIIV